VLRSILVAVALCAGCIEIPGPYVRPCEPGADEDYDGWACDGKVPDCDDGDNAVHPGAGETFATAGNGIDEDCSGSDLALDSMLPHIETSVTEAGETRVTSPGLAITLDKSNALLPRSIVELSSSTEWLRAVDPVGARVTPTLSTTDELTEFHRQSRVRGAAMFDSNVTWHHEGPPRLDGTIHFVYRADDSIIRHDEVTVRDSGVPAGGPYDAGAFLALDRARFEALNYSANPGGDSISLPGPTGVVWETVDTEPGWMCLYADTNGGEYTRSLSTSWIPSGGIGPSIAIDSAITLGFDWARQTATVPPGTYRATQNFVYTFADYCSDGAPLAESMAAPGPLDVTHGDLAVYSLGDAGEDGYDEVNGWYSVISDDDHVSFRLPTSHRGIAVRVSLGYFDNLVEHGVTVWASGARLESGRFYLSSIDSGDGFNYPDNRTTVVIWIPAHSFTDELITVAAPGGEPL
jgi:hypothetical protein